MPKISVIIPVFGVENYIERCARSLFEQTLDDIEYLFIDDCTTDRSIEILKKVLEDYPHRRQQVTIFQMEKNSGSHRVREWGIKHSTGDFIAQCDGDDWVERDMFKSLYDAAQTDCADVVVCDYFKSKGNKHRNKKGCHTTDKKEFIDDLLCKKYSWSVWNKIFKRSLFTSDFIFPEGSMAEDMLMVIQACCKAQKISHVPRPLYHYAINASSMVRTKTKESSLAHYDQQKKNTDILFKIFEMDDNLSLSRSNKCFLEYLCSINFTPLAYHDGSFLKQWRKCCPRMGLDFYLKRKIAFHHKFKYLKLSVSCFIKTYILHND